MKTLREIALRTSVILLIAGNYLPASDSISLESILMPVEQPVVEAPVVVQKEDPEPKEEEVVQERIELGLDDVLVRLEEIVARESGDSSELKLSSTSKWNSIEIGSQENWQVVLKNSFTPDIRGIWFAHIDIQVEGELIASRNLRVRASLFKEVWMVEQKLIRGAIPATASIQPVMRDIYLERGSPIPVTEDLAGYEMTRTVLEGHLLTWNDIQPRPSVRRGDIVEVVVEQGSLTVVMRARSLEDGLIGESVAVKNLNSSRELVGTVIGPDKIRFIP